MLSIIFGFIGLLLLDLLSISLCLVQENVARPITTAPVSPQQTPNQHAFAALSKTTWCLDTCDGLCQSAWYIPATGPTSHTALLFHDFRADKLSMADYTLLFHRLNYNVVLIDNRATGQSAGKYTGYGYLERIDARCWIETTLAKLGPDTKIVLFGTAMGAAIVGMTCGLTLPHNVKAAIMDSAYTSAVDELRYRVNRQYHLPAFTVHVTSKLVKLQAGYCLDQASPLMALKNSHLPTLFIHGAADETTPVAMADTLYTHYHGAKEFCIIPRAGHLRSYTTDRQQYETRVRGFLARHVA